MNILYIDSTQGSGGATKSLLDCLKYIDKNRYHLFLMVHNDGIFTKSFQEEGIILLPYNLILTKAVVFDASLRIVFHSFLSKLIKIVGIVLKIVFFVWACLRDYLLIIYTIKRKKIDIVHINNYSDHYLPLAFICRLITIPTVIHVSVEQFV